MTVLRCRNNISFVTCTNAFSSICMQCRADTHHCINDRKEISTSQSQGWPYTSYCTLPAHVLLNNCRLFILKKLSKTLAMLMKCCTDDSPTCQSCGIPLSKTHISGMCQLAGHSWIILHSVLSCILIWQSWQSYCNWFYQGNPFLPPTVIFASLTLSPLSSHRNI